MQTWTQYSCLIHSTGSDSLIKVHTCPAPCVGCFVFLSLLMPQFLLVFSRCEGKGKQAYSQKHLLAPSYCPRNRRRWTDFFLTETWLKQTFLEREYMFLKLSRHWVSSIMSSKHRKLQVWNLAQSEISAATLIRPENTIWKLMLLWQTKQLWDGTVKHDTASLTLWLTPRLLVLWGGSAAMKS